MKTFSLSMDVEDSTNLIEELEWWVAELKQHPAMVDDLPVDAQFSHDASEVAFNCTLNRHA